MSIPLAIVIGLALVGMMWALAEIWQRAEYRRAAKKQRDDDDASEERE